MKYVCSDIHGCYERYNKLLDKINFTDEDTLYILGDVIDRNPEGIRILLDIMNRKNVVLLMGNHESFMYDFLMKSKNEYDEPWVDNGLRDIWFAACNGGAVTYKAFLELDTDTQNEIYKYLGTLPYICLVNIGDKKYHLSHTGTIANVLDQQIWYRKDLTSVGRERIIWYSPYRSDCWLSLDNYPADYTCLIGHVPVQRIYYDETDYKAHIDDNLIDIDGGCAYYSDEGDGVKTALICYCLDTDEFTYIR
jgi:serine/threonine protein phosphatase 1